jgi:hypothetical protein
MSTSSKSLIVLTCLAFSTVSCIIQPPPQPAPTHVPHAPVVVTPAPTPPPPPPPPPPFIVMPPPEPVPPPLPPPPPPAPPAPHVRAGGPIEMFKDVRIGMPRPQVEALLGRPVAAEIERAGVVESWYLPPPAVTKPRLPPGGPGAISVSYRAGRVVGKRLNPQL